MQRCFNGLKNAQRLVTRYEKTTDNDLCFIQIVSIEFWMRQFVNRT